MPQVVQASVLDLRFLTELGPGRLNIPDWLSERVREHVNQEENLDEVQQDIISSLPDLIKDEIITEESANIFLKSIESIDETSPDEVFPTIINKAREEESMPPNKKKEFLIGKKLQEFLNLLTNNIKSFFSRDDYNLENTQKQLINKGLVPISKLKIMGN